MLICHSLSLKAGNKKDVFVVDGDKAEATRCQNVELLERLEALSKLVPQVDPREGVIAAQNQVLPYPYTKRM